MGRANVTATLLLGREPPAGRATTMTANQVAFSLGSAVGGYAAIAAPTSALCLAAALLVWLCRPRPAPERAPAG